MSVASKRRYITNKVESEYYEPQEEDTIAILRASRGNNLHEVEDQYGEVYLASMPSKFRKSVWVKRGQFLVLRPINEGDKVKAEIEHVLDDDNVLYIRELKKWPERFESLAAALTRDAKSGGMSDRKEKKSGWIDDDLLPPSGSDEEESENEDSYDSEGEIEDHCDEESEEEEPCNQFNPNRAKAPGNMAKDV